MKLKPLLLPILITSLSFTACGGDDNNYSSSNQPLEKPKPPVTTPQFDGELLEVGANGNVSEFGGATRLKKERTQAMRESLSDKTVKHVILFIGDGTSDSEITAARNYAEGAAGYFKGLDVLPFTGSYTTYS